jgi:short-subunit dehydrogenase
MKNLNNKVVVITGASAGVGRAIARNLATRGAKIALIARGEIKLRATRDEVIKLGGEAEIYPLDVSHEGSLEEAAVEIENKFGPIDIWINNAMVTMIGEVKDISSEEVKRVSDVNYIGSVNGILVAYRRFRVRGKGHIIQIGSALAYLSIPLQSAYCASKHAIHGFVQSFRIELKANKSPVQVSEVHLPAVNTPQFEWMQSHIKKHPMPVPPIYEPEIIAEAVSYVIDHPKKEMWVGSKTVEAILGEKFAPWLAEWRLARKGYEFQETDKAPRTGLSNMWRPVEKDFGARGIFVQESKEKSLFIWTEMHKWVTGISMLSLMGIGYYFRSNKLAR